MTARQRVRLSNTSERPLCSLPQGQPIRTREEQHTGGVKARLLSWRVISPAAYLGCRPSVGCRGKRRAPRTRVPKHPPPRSTRACPNHEGDQNQVFASVVGGKVGTAANTEAPQTIAPVSRIAPKQLTETH